MTRTTPRRRITLQCSQIGRTLERTFTGPSPKKVSSSAVNNRRARKLPQGARLRRDPHLRQHPRIAPALKAQEHRLASHVGGPEHDVAPLQLHEALPEIGRAHV